MTVADQINFLDKKIKQNEAQYDLDRKATIKSAQFSKDLVDKYESLNSEDLGYKPSVAEQAKFEYYPLGKIFNERLSKEDQKQGILKSLINIGNEKK